MAKFTLSIEDDFDFDLFGFCSHYTDYRACWALNEALGLKLVKSDESFMVSGKKGDIISAHSFYEWFDEDNLVSYYLIKNKNGIHLLVPELSQIDYFLAIKESGSVEIDPFLAQLKKTPGVLTALHYDPFDLKSAKNFVF
jgi:hypothetical protein